MKNLRTAGMNIASLQEFARLAQAHHANTEKVEEKQKGILIAQLKDIDIRLAEIQHTRDLLAHKIDTYDAHIAKYKMDEFSEKTEKLWEFQSKSLP